MLTIRRAQVLTFILTLTIGMCALWIWQPQHTFDWLDEMLAPHQNDRFQIGAQLEDAEMSGVRDRVMRKVISPTRDALDYAVCFIDDDPDDINPYGIYHPLDISTTLLNLRKQSVKRVFIGTHLQWPDQDEVELQAFALAIEKFEHVTLAFPLKRSVQPAEMPEELERSSIPVKKIHGDSSLIPQVNQLSLPHRIPLPANSYAGFSVLESEPEASGLLPLLARWGDAIIPSAYLVEMAAAHGYRPQDLLIYPGKFIRIGNTGNVIPIDHYGNFLIPTDYELAPPPRTLTSAYSSETSMIGSTQPAAILTATGEKSAQFNALSSPYLYLSQLNHTPRVGSALIMPRLPQWLELIVIVDLALLVAWLLPCRPIRRNTSLTCSIFSIGLISLILYHGLNYWTPISLYLCTLLAGWLICSLLSKPARKHYLDQLNQDS